MNLPNLLRHISLRRLRHQKAHTFMTAAGICLGVAAVVSVGLVNESVLRSFADSIDRVAGKAVLQVEGAASGFPESMLDRVQRVPGVAYAVPVIETQGILLGKQNLPLLVLGVDVLQDANVRSYALAGKGADIPDPLLFLARPDSLLLTRELAEREGITIDQRVRMETVRGIRSFRVRGLLDPAGPARVAGGAIAIMDYPAAQLAFGKEGRIDRIDVSLVQGEPLDVVRERIVRVLPAGYTVTTPAGRTRQVASLVTRFQKNINLISFIAVFVGMYLIYNAVSISVVRRRKEIGILRALGVTRREVALLFLGETLITAVVASALGLALGIGFARAALGTVEHAVSELYVRTAVTGLAVGGPRLLAGFLTGVGTSLCAALFPARASARITPVSAIRSTPYVEESPRTHRRLALAALLLIVFSFTLALLPSARAMRGFVHAAPVLFTAALSLLFGVSLATPLALDGFLAAFHRLISPHVGAAGRLAGLNLRKNLMRNAVAAAAVFYGIAVFVGSAGIITSTKRSVMEWIDSYVHCDIMVTSGHPLATSTSQSIPMPVAMAAKINMIPGVLSVDPYRKITIDLQGRRVLLLAIDIKQRLAYSPLTIAAGRREDLLRFLPRQDGICVNEAFAAREHIHPGDALTLATPGGPVTFRVAAVIVDYSSDSGSLLMDLHTFQKYWQDFLADSFSVRVRPGTAVRTVQDEIVHRFGTDRRLYVLPAREFRREIMKIIDQGFSVNRAVNVITLLIACLGIIVTLLASVLERTREIGILRSIGMLRGQVARVVVIESLLLGLVGGILGCCAGIAIGWMSLEGFLRGDYGASMRYHVALGAILQAILLSALLSAAAGLYPAHHAARTNITEALAYE